MGITTETGGLECTISVILFSAVINLPVKSAEKIRRVAHQGIHWRPHHHSQISTWREMDFGGCRWAHHCSNLQNPEAWYWGGGVSRISFTLRSERTSSQWPNRNWWRAWLSGTGRTSMTSRVWRRCSFKLKPGWHLWRRAAYPVSIRPGDTNMGCFPDCSGHCLFMR